MRTENYTDAYSPKEIKDKEKFLLWVKVKKRLIYILKVLNCIFALGVGLMFVYPFAWMASMSLRPLTEALKFNPNIIKKIRYGTTTFLRGIRREFRIISAIR